MKGTRVDITTKVIRDSLATAILYLRHNDDRITLAEAIELLDNLIRTIETECVFVYKQDEDKFGRVVKITINSVKGHKNPSVEDVLTVEGVFYPEDLAISVTCAPIKYDTAVKWILDSISAGGSADDDNLIMFICAIIKEFAHIMFDWFVLCTEVIVKDVCDDIGIILPLSFAMQSWCSNVPFKIKDYRMEKKGIDSIFRPFYGIYLDKTLTDRMVPARITVNHVEIMGFDD